MHNRFVNKQLLIDQNQVINATNAYKANMAEKLSIIANSTIFIDYLRSGYITRDQLYTQFLSQLSTLKSKSIVGMEILDKHDNQIFSYGNLLSKCYVTVSLCYLNQSLDSKMGECDYAWKLYFDKDTLLSDFFENNVDINACKNCTQYIFFNSSNFGSMPIISASNFKIGLAIKHDRDYSFYFYFILITSTVLFFGGWSWYRINSIINKYIAKPIENLTSCLKIDFPVDSTDNIQEIAYLINEINAWKKKLRKVQADENLAKLGQIAAQLAHDVRSPLSVIDILVRNLIDIPEDTKAILRSALQRISDIANNFLTQYAQPSFIDLENGSSQHIPTLLMSILSEKRSQYMDRSVTITLACSSSCYDLFAKINPVEFKRILSNLINNSMEAIAVTSKGKIHVSLSRLNNEFLIDVFDNGRGIHSKLLPQIMKGGFSSGKKKGHGLGLSHAINTVNQWQGTVAITSKLNHSTNVVIRLPLSQEIPTWFVPSLAINTETIIYVLDDERSAYEELKNRLPAHTIHYFDNFEKLEEFIRLNKKSKSLFLIDYDLGEHHPNGIKIIEQLNIQFCTILITNRYDDILLQQQCSLLDIKLLPKPALQQVPIYFD